MDVKEARQFARLRVAGLVCTAAVGLASMAYAQVQVPDQNPSSTANPFYGSVTAHAVSGEPLKLSLDDAIRRGLENNLGLREAESGEKLFQGEKNEALQEFLPTINLSGGTGVFQHNLAAQGFGPKTLDAIWLAVSGWNSARAFADYERRSDAGTTVVKSDAVFGCGDCGMEGCGSGGKVGIFPEDVGARRSGAAGCDGIPACDCGCQRGGQRDGADEGR